MILDGFAVSLPERKLPALLKLKVVNKVYPSLGYFATDDSGPTVINAAGLEAASGDGGQGIKIGVVDTGVDPTNPFLSPAGFSYPSGFPKGDTKLTTPKVIVARVFPGPIRNATERQAVRQHGAARHARRRASPPVTRAPTAPAGPDHPATASLSGVAPKAWIGNYRVFTIPTPLGDEADTPEIVAAFESAVEDGMNVINFSGGGPQTDPANDAMYEAVHNTVLAGVVPVIAAGNDREDFGLRHGRLARQRARRDHRRGGLELARVRARPQRDRRAAGPRRSPDPGLGRCASPPPGRRLNQTVVDAELDRRHRREARRPVPVRIRCRAEHERRDAARRLAEGKDRPAAPRQLHLRLEGAAGGSCRCDRDDLHRQPPR